MIVASHIPLKVAGVDINQTAIGAGQRNIYTDVIELPQYADSLVFEVKGNNETKSFTVQFQTSADKTNWYNIGEQMTSDSMQAMSDDQEHCFLFVRAKLNDSADIAADIDAGDIDLCKIHYRVHKR